VLLRDVVNWVVIVRTVVTPSAMRAGSEQNEKQGSSRARRNDMPPTAVRRWQKSRPIYVRPRTRPQSAHLWRPAVAKLQAASVPIA